MPQEIVGTNQLMKLIEHSPGTRIYIDDLIAAFPGSDRKLIFQAMLRVMNKNWLPGLARVTEGVWIYNPGRVASVESGKLFEQIGQSKNGMIVLQDEEGNLYRAEELS